MVPSFGARRNKKPLVVPKFSAELWSVETKKTLGTPKFDVELWNAKRKKMMVKK